MKCPNCKKEITNANFTLVTNPAHLTIRFECKCGKFAYRNIRKEELL